MKKKDRDTLLWVGIASLLIALLIGKLIMWFDILFGITGLFCLLVYMLASED